MDFQVRGRRHDHHGNQSEGHLGIPGFPRQKPCPDYFAGARIMRGREVFTTPHKPIPRRGKINETETALTKRRQVDQQDESR